MVGHSCFAPMWVRRHSSTHQRTWRYRPCFTAFVQAYRWRHAGRGSAALIRWLMEQYDIPRTNIFGHDFTPGYCRPGGTSCPDKLFGTEYAQSTIAAWVEANV